MASGRTRIVWHSGIAVASKCGRYVRVFFAHMLLEYFCILETKVAGLEFERDGFEGSSPYCSYVSYRS